MIKKIFEKDLNLIFLRDQISDKVMADRYILVYSDSRVAFVTETDFDRT